MADARRPDSSLIDSALSAGSPHVRAVAALSIGQSGAQALAPRLRTLMLDVDTAVAANAAFSIGLLRDSLAVAELSRALALAPTLAVEAAWSLGEIGAPARTAIIAGLRDGPAAAGYLPELLRASAKLRPLPVAAIAPHLSGTDSVRLAATYALGRSGPPAAARHLLGVASHAASPGRTTGAGRRDDHEAMALVARGLASGAAGDSLREPALETLRTLVRHPHPHVRINALRSLGSYGANARDEVIAAVRDPDANVRITAAQSAGAVLDSAPGTWRHLWEADTSFAFRASLLASAARSRPADLVRALAPGWSADSAWRIRAAHAAALAAAPPGPQRDAALASAASDRDPRVRIATLGALGDSTAPPAARQRLLAIAAEDDDPFVRGSALSALGRRATAAEVPALLRAYRRAAADTVNDARLSALTALAGAWRRDSVALSPAVAAELRALPPPADPLERLAARSASPFAHWPGGEGTARTLGWYEERVRSHIAPALAGRTRVAVFSTARGPITVELFGADAPLTVDNFTNLVRAGYYAGSRFHRVVPNFVAQDGDPRGDGNGGPGYAIRDELNRRRYARGAMGMALSGPDTGGSQFFFTHSPQPHLDGHYTVFGRIVDGWSALDDIVQGDAILGITLR